MGDAPDSPKAAHRRATDDLADGHGIEPWTSALASAGRTRVEVAALVYGDSPRSGGIDSAHVERLVESAATWPPIIVHAPSLRIVDGFHRVAAATVRGLTHLDALLIDVPPEWAFAIGVRANVSHGLPLTLSDRRAAAARVLHGTPEWSDRAIAAATGLSASTVRGIRDSVAGLDSANRTGRDGRSRPVTAAAGRRLAAELIEARPRASLREIATAAGISPGTVRDVRARLARGEDPVLPSERPTPEASRGPALHVVDAETPLDLGHLLATLSKDPALRMNDDGRDLLRWLHRRAVTALDCERFPRAVPDHCVDHLVELAQRCAANWVQIASRLDAGRVASNDDGGLARSTSA